MIINMDGLIANSDELRKLILAHPELPIAVCAGESANGGDFIWQYCTFMSCNVGKLLNIKTPYDRDNYVFNDEDDFEDAVRDTLADKPEYIGLSDDDFDAAVKAEITKYTSGWKDVIFIHVDN